MDAVATNMIAKREVFCSRNGSSDTNKINVKNTRGTSTGPCMAVVLDCNRRIFADVIVYIFAHWHTTYIIEALAVYMS